MPELPTLLDEAMAVIKSYHPKCDFWSDHCLHTAVPEDGKQYHSDIRRIIQLTEPAPRQLHRRPA